MTAHRPPAGSRRTVLRIGLAALAGWRGQACGQPAPVRPEAVEAAYLHKLPGFVEWPAQAFASPSSPIVVGVAGAPQVLEELSRIAKGRLVVGRSVEPRAVDLLADVPHDLHLLFIGPQAARSGRALVEAARAHHALVVTDLADGLDAGAAVAFVHIDGRLRLEVSLGNTRKCGLKLSSQLMGVAWKVTEDGE